MDTTTKLLYARQFFVAALFVISGAGILGRRAWARKLALALLVLTLQYDISPTARVFAQGGPISAANYLASFLEHAFGNGLLFYLIYRKRSADALPERREALNEGNPGARGLPWELKFAALYLLVGGTIGIVMPPVPAGPVPLGWLGTPGPVGMHARVYLLDAMFAVCGAGILYRKNWAGHSRWPCSF